MKKLKIGIAAVCLFALSSLATTASAAELELKFSLAAPETSLYGRTAGMLVKQWVEDALAGRAEVKIFGANTLVPYKDSYRAYQIGLADMGYMNVGMHPGTFPLSEVLQLPGLAPKIAAGSYVFLELQRLYPEEFAAQFSPDVKVLASFQYMLADLHSTKPIRSLDDLKGKVIGATSDLAAEALQRLGASSSLIDFTQMNQQLERGVLDGVVGAWGMVKVTGAYEVAKYHTVLRMFPTVGHFMMSRKTWNKLTPDEQSRLELLGPWIQFANAAGVAGISQAIRSSEITPEKGHEMIELPAADYARMRETFRPMWDEWAAQAEEKGLPGKQILADVIRLVDTFSYE